jgi:hypothetical protein
VIHKIIAGGQTGVDRAALDFAIAMGIPHGGWCPLKRTAEDGTINDKYLLTETTTADYSTRTKLNVRDSDGTLVLNVDKLEGGTLFTVQCAHELDKPCLIVDLDNIPDRDVINCWFTMHNIRILNIAGPRESKCPGIYDRAMKTLSALIVTDHV